MSIEQVVTFGDLLRRHRTAVGLTQDELAERAGLSVRAISDLERGVKTRPHRETVALLATALGLDERTRVAFEAARERQTPPPDACLSVGPVAWAQRDAPLPPFMGRSHETLLLERHLEGKGPPVLLLAGEPGIGKSRLLHEAARQAAGHGLTVLAGGCQRREGQEPYAPFLQALENDLHRQSRAQARTSLRGCAWLVRLLPELADVLEPLPPWTVSPEQERRLLFGAVARYLANVAGPAGTLLLLDDLQWAGRDALDLLATLLRTGAAAGASLRVLGAYRDTEVQAQDALAVTLADLAHARLATQHLLRPLAPAEAAHLLHALLLDGAPVDPALRQRVVRRTGGVPFLLVSCAHVLHAGSGESAADEVLPWDVAQGIRQRVAALPETAQQILSMAAVAGRRVPPALLIQVTARPEEEVLTALETARRARLLVEGDNESYQFAHDLIWEVVERDLGTARRTMWHRRVAEALEQAPGEPPVEQVAYHYTRSAERDKAVLYLEQAGDRAVAQYANGTAEGYYRELVDRLDRLGRRLDSARAREKLGSVLATVTRYDEALALLEHAAAVYRSVGDGQGELRALARIGRAHAWRGTPTEGIDRLQPVLASHEADRPSPELALLHVVLARLYFYTGRYTDELAAAERAGDLARMLSDAHILAEAEQRRGVALMMVGRWDEALEMLEGAILRAEAIGDLFVLGRALVAAGAIHLERGEGATALAYRERAVEVAERLGDPAEIAFMRSALGWTLFCRGDWSKARQQCDQALGVLASSGAELAPAYPLYVLGILCLAEGDEEAASRHLERCAILARQSGDLQALRFAQRGLAVRDVLVGQAGTAQVRLDPLLERPDLEDLVTDLLPVLAWTHLERGDETGAGAIAQQAIRRAAAAGDRIMLAEAQCIRGMVAAQQGRWEEAEQAFHESLDLTRAVGYPYEEGRVLYEWGMMLKGKGTSQRHHPQTQGQAQDRLEGALAIFRRLGAARDAARARQAIDTLRGA